MSDGWILCDPAVLAGKPCIRGTRISVELVIELLAGGASHADILRAYPHVPAEGLAEVMRFDKWKAKLVTSPDVMGGEPVFLQQRLTVRRVGEMLERGESPEVVREDYPYLLDEDLEFALLFVRAYPRGAFET